MGTVVVIRHVAFEDLGLLEGLLAERGHKVDYLEAPTGDLSALDPLASDLLVVLGGPISADDESDYPFLERMKRILARRLAEDRPTLGICLGAQLMARSLNARVYPAEEKEIGWAPVVLTDAGRASPLRHLDSEQTQVLHWHGENFDLPVGAYRLAETNFCPNQAFSYGRNGLGLQFHPEVLGQELEKWFVGHTVEIGVTPGLSVGQLRADTRKYCESLENCGMALFRDWLETIGL